MPRAEANGIVIEYDVTGPPDGSPLLLIHGLGAQLIRWPAALLDGFVAAGFRVIRFDSRDVGLSTHLREAPVPDLAAVLAARRRGDEPDLPYTMSDMAADTAGLLDALGIARAHVLGVSLGGMIAQVLALEHSDRLLSLNIMMSQPGDPELAVAQSPAMAAMTAPPPDPSADREGYLRHSIAMNRALGSPDYPTPEAALRDFAVRTVERAYDPAGVARQLAAGRGSADRRAALKAVSVPTLVIHGVDDPLVPLAGGEQIARAVKGAWLVAVNGMGHDLPPQLFDLFVKTVAANAARAAERSL